MRGWERERALRPSLVQPHFSRGQNIENPFLGLSRLPNPTETLATQATVMRLISDQNVEEIADLSSYSSFVKGFITRNNIRMSEKGNRQFGRQGIL